MILTSSVEVEKLRQRNCDLEKEMELIEDKLREMTSKYENLEVKLSPKSYFHYFVFLGHFCKETGGEKI